MFRPLTGPPGTLPIKPLVNQLRRIDTRFGRSLEFQLCRIPPADATQLVLTALAFALTASICAFASSLHVF